MEDIGIHKETLNNKTSLVSVQVKLRFLCTPDI